METQNQACFSLFPPLLLTECSAVGLAKHEKRKRSNPGANKLKKENVYSRAAVHLVSSEKKGGKKERPDPKIHTNPKHRKGSQSSAGRNLPPEEKEKTPC